MMSKKSEPYSHSVELGVFGEVGLPAPEPPELMIPTGFLTAYSPLETVGLPMPPMLGKSNIDRLLFAQRLLKCAEEAGARFLEKTAALGPAQTKHVHWC